MDLCLVSAPADNGVVVKTCSRCRETRPAEAFHRSPRTTDGLQGWCQDCAREYKRQPKAMARSAAATARWRERNPDKVKAMASRHRLAKHGVTSAMYEEMLSSQNGVCAVCGDGPKDRLLAVDHDHSCCPGKYSCGACVRGLLCGACNGAAGFLLDDSKRALRLSYYLESK